MSLVYPDLFTSTEKEFHFKEDTSKLEKRGNLTLFHLLMNKAVKEFIFLTNVILLFLVASSNAQEIQGKGVKSLEIPKVSKWEAVISHTGYSFSYNEEHEQSAWVAYELTKEETIKTCERTDRFKPDPAVSTLTACDADYARTGYDRGHLAPAADMGWSITTMAESFYYSNMSPQVHGFNAGIWKTLEEQVRFWAVENQSVLIVTGPVLKKGLMTIGANQVSVPELYYKVILDNHEPEIKAIAFLIPNASQSADLQSFVVSIDNVESVTELDFFPEVPDEESIENNCFVQQWSWTGTSKRIVARTEVPDKKITLTSNTPKASASVQCSGLTKVGTRCKNKTLNKSRYCHLHDG